MLFMNFSSSDARISFGERLCINILAYSYSFIYRVGIQPIAFLFAYLLSLFFNKIYFPDYKEIVDYQPIDANSWQHITLFTFMIICLIESLMISLGSILFFNDYSIMKANILCTNSWQSPALDLVIKIYISLVFPLDSQVSNFLIKNRIHQ